MLEQLTRNWWVIALRGAAGIFFGLAAFFWPGLTLAVMVALFGAYALVDGVFAIVTAIASAREGERWGMFVLEGIVGIGAGLVTFVWPGITTIALLSVIAAWSIFTGVLEIAAAIRLRRAIEGEWVLVLSGIASLLLGVLLLARPLAGVLAFVWLVGTYALMFGILFLALALRLRSMGQSVQRRATA